MAKNNYATKNTSISDAEKAEWGISAKLGTVKQINVALNNKKSFDYLTRFEAQTNNVAVIGNAFAWQIGCCADPMETTGEMGSVSEVAAKVSVKRNHAAEIDFVFTQNITKKSITAAAGYLNTEANAATLQYGKETENIYPLTYSIRKMLAAATILAFPGLASAKDIASAKAYIHAELKFTDEVFNISHSGGYFPATIWLSDDHYSYGKPALSDLEKSKKIYSFSVIGEDYIDKGAFFGELIRDLHRKECSHTAGDSYDIKGKVPVICGDLVDESVESAILLLGKIKAAMHFGHGC